MSGFIEARGAKRKVIAINQQLLALVAPLLLQTNTGNEPPPPPNHADGTALQLVFFSLQLQNICIFIIIVTISLLKSI